MEQILVKQTPLLYSIILQQKKFQNKLPVGNGTVVISTSAVVIAEQSMQFNKINEH